MWVLALDTTARAGSVALVRDDTVVIEHAGDGTRTHAERLPAELRAVLAEAGLSPTALDVLAVARGPGAFTGLRIGLATIQGLAVALDRPVAAVSSLEAHAWALLDQSHATGTVGIWLDAQRGEVFAATYRAAERPQAWPLEERDAPQVASPSAVAASWSHHRSSLCVGGDGALRHCEALAACGHTAISLPACMAGRIGRLGGRLAALGALTRPHDVQPLYVRRPDAERDRTIDLDRLRPS